jgi:hypothetical protein
MNIQFTVFGTVDRFLELFLKRAKANTLAGDQNFSFSDSRGLYASYTYLERKEHRKPR